MTLQVVVPRPCEEEGRQEHDPGLRVHVQVADDDEEAAAAAAAEQKEEEDHHHHHRRQ